MTAWVLLRGWTREAAHWGDFPARLGARFPGEAILTPDLPGNGARHGVRSPARIAAMVEDCRECVRAAAAPPYRLLGLSMGAMVGMEWMHRHPQELTCAVLVNASARPFGRVHERLRPRCYGAVLRILGERDLRRREAAILALTSALRGGDASLVEEWACAARERPVSRANVLRQLLAAARYRAPRQPPPVPLLLAASLGDRLVDPACTRRLAQAWNAPLALHAWAGHDLPLDDGEWLAAEAARWVRRS